MGSSCIKLRVCRIAFGIFALSSIALFGTTNEELIEPEISDKDRNHWAFQPVDDGKLPEVKNDEQVRNGIDHYILARLEDTFVTIAATSDCETASDSAIASSSSSSSSETGKKR